MAAGTTAVHSHRRLTVKRFSEMKDYEKEEYILGGMVGREMGWKYGLGLGAVFACIAIAFTPYDTPGSALLIRAGVIMGAFTFAWAVIGGIAGKTFEQNLIDEGYYDDPMNRSGVQQALEDIRKFPK
jgi:hypothetical protein